MTHHKEAPDEGNTEVKPVVDTAKSHTADETSGAGISDAARKQLANLWGNPAEATKGLLTQVDPNNPWHAQQHQMEKEAEQARKGDKE